MDDNSYPPPSPLHLSRHGCAAQIEKSGQIKTFLKFLLKEHCGDDLSWENELVPLLCEYYSTTNQYHDLLKEILAGSEAEDPPPDNVEVSIDHAAALRAHASLINLNDFTLVYNYGISLTIH